MVAMPAVRAVTAPVAETVATAGLLLVHQPVEAVPVKLETVPVQAVAGPLTVPALGKAFTVIILDAEAVPQVLLMT
jgi:hypothetical protein